jgi:hypothetical protein
MAGRTPKFFSLFLLLFEETRFAFLCVLLSCSSVGSSRVLTHHVVYSFKPLFVFTTNLCWVHAHITAVSLSLSLSVYMSFTTRSSLGSIVCLTLHLHRQTNTCSGLWSRMFWLLEWRKCIVQWRHTACAPASYMHCETRTWCPFACHHIVLCFSVSWIDILFSWLQHVFLSHRENNIDRGW